MWAVGVCGRDRSHSGFAPLDETYDRPRGPTCHAARGPIEPDRHDTDVVGARIGAQIVDLVSMFVVLLAAALSLVVLLRPRTVAGDRGPTLVSLLSLPAYGTVLEAYWNGQTVGKRLVDVTDVDRRGQDPTLGQAFLRNLPAVVLFSWLTVAAALARMAMTDYRQRVFDEAANTYVVRTR